MRRRWILAPLAALAATVMLGACVVAPAGRGGGVVVAPPLPVVVELGFEPFYYHDGFHYHYDNRRWRYARSRSGPWVELPRDRYPRETRFRGRSDRGDRDDRRDRDEDRRDDRDRDRGDRGNHGDRGRDGRR